MLSIYPKCQENEFSASLGSTIGLDFKTKIVTIAGKRVKIQLVWAFFFYSDINEAKERRILFYLLLDNYISGTLLDKRDFKQ
jgi:hypothetical protein